MFSSADERAKEQAFREAARRCEGKNTRAAYRALRAAWSQLADQAARIERADRDITPSAREIMQLSKSITLGVLETEEVGPHVICGCCSIASLQLVASLPRYEYRPRCGDPFPSVDHQSVSYRYSSLVPAKTYSILEQASE
jgi:hypothetical protein